jgi:DUF4097 and DUF4098 domain-containing protein YvlB
MKKEILIPIIIGASLLVLGGIIVGVSAVKGALNTKIITNTYQLEDDQDFHNFKIDLSIADLEFKVSEDGKRKVEIKETERIYHTVLVEDDTLKIAGHDQHRWYEFFNFARGLKVTLYLPAGDYHTLDVEVATGNILIPSDFSFNNVDFEIATGSVDLAADISETLAIETATGNVTLHDLHAGPIEIDVATGHVTLTEVTATSLRVETATGKVTLNQTITTGKMTIATSTGSVRLNEVDAASLDIETSTGSVTGTILTSKVFDAKSDTGTVKVPSTTTGGACKVRTSTGNIDLAIKS